MATRELKSSRLTSADAASLAVKGLKVCGLSALASAKRPPYRPGSHDETSGGSGKGYLAGRREAESPDFPPHPAKISASNNPATAQFRQVFMAKVSPANTRFFFPGQAHQTSAQDKGRKPASQRAKNPLQPAPAGRTFGMNQRLGLLPIQLHQDADAVRAAFAVAQGVHSISVTHHDFQVLGR